jgi:myo-inositol 2-dehydrogenase/D-chiro-inositol 1-dehydrogenase
VSLGFCIVGAGRIGPIHARHVAASDQATLRYVVDIDVEAAGRLADEHGAKATGDPEVAFADPDVGAVIVCSSSGTHAEFTARAVAAGKAVFCEKPFDLDLDRARACLRAVADAAAPVFMAFNRRFDPSHRAVHEAIESGELGEVEIVSIVSRDPYPPPVEYLKGSPKALFRETTVHDLDLARWLLGEEPVSLNAMASCLIEPDFRALDEVDTAVVTMRTASGKLCHIENSWRAAYGYDQRVEVLGSKGMARSGNPHRTSIERFAAQGSATDPIFHFFMDRYIDSYVAELDHFIEVAAGRTEPAITAYDGVAALVLAEAAIESAGTGQTVAVPAVGG